MVYIGISYSVDFIWDFPIAIGKPIHFGDSWLDPPVLLPSPYHNPLLDLFQIFYTLLTSLNARISRGLEQFHSLNLAKSAQVTRIRKDDWSRAECTWSRSKFVVRAPELFDNQQIVSTYIMMVVSIMDCGELVR